MDVHRLWQRIPFYDLLWDQVIDHWIKCCCVDFSFIWSNPLDRIISTQNKVLTKVTQRFVALDLMSYFNSTKVKWNFSYCDCFTLKRENSPDFLCMNAMHTSVCSMFVTPLPGILQSLPLKLNFVLEVWSLSRFRSVVLTCADLNFSRTPWWSHWI